MNALYIHRAREYSDLVDKNLYGRLFVEWTHPDIPMWGAELILDDKGYFVDVGKTVTEDYTKTTISHLTK